MFRFTSELVLFLSAATFTSPNPLATDCSLKEGSCLYGFHKDWTGSPVCQCEISECVSVACLTEQECVLAEVDYSDALQPTCVYTGVKNVSNPCEYPLEPGGCGNSNDMWYYDRVTGQCGSFLYSGCQGNLNNFHSRAECEEMCTENTVTTSSTTISTQSSHIECHEAQFFSSSSNMCEHCNVNCTILHRTTVQHCHLVDGAYVETQCGLCLESYYLDELPDNDQPCGKCNHITTNINCILWQQQHQTTESLTYPQETTTDKETTTYKKTIAQRPHVNTDSVVYLGEISTVKTEAVIDIADTQLVVAVIVPVVLLTMMIGSVVVGWRYYKKHKKGTDGANGEKFQMKQNGTPSVTTAKSKDGDIKEKAALLSQ